MRDQATTPQIVYTQEQVLKALLVLCPELLRYVEAGIKYQIEINGAGRNVSVGFKTLQNLSIG